MSEFFKVKTILPKDGNACKVEIIKKVGEPEEDNYGNTVTPYDIKVNDKDLMRMSASETQVKGMKEVGCNPFVIKRWDSNGKVGFNFLPPDDINAQEQNCEPSISSAQIEKNVQGNKDDYADKTSRGASFNLGFALCLKELEDGAIGTSIPDFCGKVVVAAEQIAVYQKAFVNKTQSAPETPDGKGERYEDKAPDPAEELPPLPF